MRNFSKWSGVGSPPLPLLAGAVSFHYEVALMAFIVLLLLAIMVGGTTSSPAVAPNGTFPLVEDCDHRLLFGGVVGGDVQQILGGGLGTPELVDRVSQVVLEMNAPITSASTTSGSSLHCREKR